MNALPPYLFMFAAILSAASLDKLSILPVVLSALSAISFASFKFRCNVSFIAFTSCNKAPSSRICTLYVSIVLTSRLLLFFIPNGVPSAKVQI